MDNFSDDTTGESKKKKFGDEKSPLTLSKFMQAIK